jgi:hypothetical protein
VPGRRLTVREFTTTLLDAAGLSLIAAGVAGGLWSLVGAWAMCAAGLVVLVGSWVATRGDDT